MVAGSDRGPSVGLGVALGPSGGGRQRRAGGWGGHGRAGRGRRRGGGVGCSGPQTGPHVSARMPGIQLALSRCPGPVTQPIWRGREGRSP